VGDDAGQAALLLIRDGPELDILRGLLLGSGLLRRSGVVCWGFGMASR